MIGHVAQVVEIVVFGNLEQVFAKALEISLTLLVLQDFLTMNNIEIIEVDPELEGVEIPTAADAACGLIGRCFRSRGGDGGPGTVVVPVADDTAGLGNRPHIHLHTVVEAVDLLTDHFIVSVKLSAIRLVVV